MSDFCPLIEPKPYSQRNLWFVMVQRMGASPTRLLNIRGEVVKLDQHTVGMYFKTEADAHSTAYRYYTDHSEHYPYTAAWVNCSQSKYIVTATQTIESQVMRFK